MDIQKLVQQHKNAGRTLNGKAKQICAEFSGLPELWFFRYTKADGKVHIGGGDYYFKPTTNGGWYEQSLLPGHIRQAAVPLLNAGFHMPGTVWLGGDDTLYHTFEYSDDVFACNTVAELLEHDIQLPGKDIYLTL